MVKKDNKIKCKHYLRGVSPPSAGRGSVPAVIQCEKCGVVWIIDTIGGMREEDLN